MFSVMLNSSVIKFEFKVELLPYDFKMSFLAGELSNASHYLVTFANANKDNHSDVNKSFSMHDENAGWRPFDFKTRIQDVVKVQNKEELLRKSRNGKISRPALTTYISKVLHSRQEHTPLLGRYIDFAKCEPLHLKNNVCMEMFRKLMDIALNLAHLSDKVSFNNLPEINIFVKFVDCVKKGNVLQTDGQ